MALARRLACIFCTLALLGLQGCAGGLFGPKFLACETSGITDVKLSSGSRYVGEFQCWEEKGIGRINGRGTLYKADGTVVLAERWLGPYGTESMEATDGEIEIRYPSGEVNRYVATQYSFYEMPVFNGEGSLSGVTRLLYASFPKGTDLWIVYVAGKESVKHLGPKSIAALKIECPGVPDGYVMVEGTCNKGQPHGDVKLYSPDGLDGLLVSYANGVPYGTMGLSRIRLRVDHSDYKDELFQNIVSPQKEGNLWVRERVRLEHYYEAKGTPKLVKRDGKPALDFAGLDRFAHLSQSSVETFQKGYTTGLWPDGSGQCLHYRINFHNEKKFANNLEPCSYAGVPPNSAGDLSRTDQTAANRLAQWVEDEKREKQEREERWAEIERERAEDHRRAEQEYQERRQAMGPAPTPFDGLDRLQRLNRPQARTPAPAAPRASANASASTTVVVVTQPAPSSPSRQSAATSTSSSSYPVPAGPKLVTKVEDFRSEGLGASREEGCSAARKSIGKYMVRKPRVLSTGECSCSSMGKGMGAGAKTTYVCHLSGRWEATYEDNKVSTESGPARNTSR